MVLGLRIERQVPCRAHVRKWLVNKKTVSAHALLSVDGQPPPLPRFSTVYDPPPPPLIFPWSLSSSSPITTTITITTTRALHDSLMVIKRMLESNILVAGGGAVETALSIYLESFATTLGSREQLAIAEFAEALLVIPKTLAVNAAQVSR